MVPRLEEHDEDLPLTFLKATALREMKIDSAPQEKAGMEIDTWIPWPGGGTPDSV